MFRHYYSGILTLCCLLAVFTLISTIIQYFTTPFSSQAFFFSLVWSLLTIAFLVIAYQSSRVGFLLSFFSLLVLLRILSENHLYGVIPVFLIFLMLVILFFYIVYHNIRHFSASQQFFYGIPVRISLMEWHLIFVRMYIGFDLIAHCAEKLFSGPVPFQADVKAFAALGITHPEFFVTLAGLIELAGAISLGLGFFTRLGAMGTTLYLLLATALGHHFRLGFTWVDPGGGWEYPVMWGVLILSFGLLGDTGKYSIDSVLQEKYKLPRGLKKLMGSPTVRDRAQP